MNKDFKTGLKIGLSAVFGVAALASACVASIGYFDMAYSDGTLDALKGYAKNAFLIAGGISAAALAFVSTIVFIVEDFDKKAGGALAASGGALLFGLVSHMAMAFPNVAEKLEQDQPEAIEQPAEPRYSVPQPGDYQ